MNKIKLLLFTILVLFIPTLVFAEEVYKDNIYDIVGEEKTNTVTIYFFHQETCPHCKKENIFLNELQEKYKDDVIIKRYEVSKSQINSDYLVKAKEKMDVDTSGVPFTVMGDKVYIGYTDTIGSSIEKNLKTYIDALNTQHRYLP